MNAMKQIDVVEEQFTETGQQEIELNLADMDLVGGGNAGNTFC